MSLADFVQAVQALYSPHSDASTRQRADQWLISFKPSLEAWTVARQALDGSNLEASLQAAQILAWKAKKQQSQLSLQQQSQLVELLTGKLSGQDQLAAPIRRALCVALAQLVIQCTDWSRPLEALGERPCPHVSPPRRTFWHLGHRLYYCMGMQGTACRNPPCWSL